MSAHLSEEQLVLHHYGEAADATAIESHLSSCDSCRESARDLRRFLSGVEADPVPERGEAYGAEVWQRLRHHLSPEEPTRPRRRLALAFAPPLRRWAALGGLAAMLALAFLLGRHSQRPDAPAAQPISERVRERILLVDVGDHLERSQMVLVEVLNAAGEGDLDISTEQEWARSLVAANRLYRQSAARSGEPALASVLDELEPILLEIAHGPSPWSAQELRDFQERMEAKGILFKVRVLGSRVHRREQEDAPDRTGAVS